MHKNIVNILKQIFEDWDENHNWLDIHVRSQATDGFWGMIIEAKEDKEYILPHLQAISLAVGHLYGEGLNIHFDSEKNRILID